MTIERLDKNVIVYKNSEARWVRSEFPHSLVTIDYDEDDNVISVTVVVPDGLLDESEHS